MAKKSKAVSVEFWKLDWTTNSGLSFEEAVLNIMDPSRTVSSRNMVVPDGYVRVTQFDKLGDGYMGQFRRFRTDQLPKIGHRNVDDVREVEMDDQEAIMETLIFGYFPVPQVLILHVNRDAGGLNRLLRCIEKTSPLKTIGGHPIIDPEREKKSQSFGRISVAELTIVRPNEVQVNANQLSVEGALVTNAKTQWALTGALTVRTELRLNKSRRGTLRDVVDAFKNLANNPSANVEAARLEGRDRDNDPMMVDLVNDRMRDKIVVNSAGLLSDDDVREAISRAWTKRKEVVATGICVHQFVSEEVLGKVANKIAEKILDVSAISIGFMAAALSILLAAQHIPAAERLKAHGKFKTLIDYYSKAIAGGFLSVTTSLATMGSDGLGLDNHLR
ncbi:MAG: hypothetical protein Q9226_009220, partial [Calogaya cf. arnoldii]